MRKPAPLALPGAARREPVSGSGGPSGRYTGKGKSRRPARRV